MSAQLAVYNTTLLGSTGLAVTTSSATVANNSTFSPDGVTRDGTRRWVDRGGLTSGGVIAPVFYPVVAMSASLVRGAAKANVPGNGHEKTKLRVSLPLPNVTSPSTGSGIQPQASKSGDITFNVDCDVPEWATDAQRVFALSLFYCALADYIYASDGSPSQLTGSPFRARILTGEGVW